MSVEIDLRLAALVETARQMAGSWHGLQEDIRAHSPDRRAVDRRKLRKIVAASARDDNVSLSLSDMLALQNYFVSKRMLRLDDNMLFEVSQSLLSGFRGATSLTVLLPTRYVKAIETECASRWDMRAVEQLLRAPQLSGLPLDMEDVFHFGKTKDGKALRKKIASEAWYKKLSDSNIICVSSPFVCYATEQLLCRMCGVETAFENPRGTAVRPLPFRFYWPDRMWMSPSAFEISETQLHAQLGELPDSFDPDERGLLVDNVYYPANADALSHDLIVAQRYKGNFLMVLSAIHAPATLGIAHCVARGDVPISQASDHRQSDFLDIAVARTRFKRVTEDVGRDRREWIDTNLVEGQPRIWNRKAQRWDD